MIDRLVSAGRRTLIILSLLISVLAGCSAFYGYIKTVSADDDDLLYLYTSGLAVRSPGMYKALSDVLVEAETRAGADAETLYRLAIRRDYINGYFLASAMYSIVDRLVDRFAVDYQLPSVTPASAERSGLYPFHMVFGFWATFLLCFGSVLWIVARQGDWRLALAMSATLSLLAVYGLTPEGGDHRFVYLWHENPSQLSANVSVFFWNPKWYSFLHFTPRSNFAMLALGIFVLRWTRHVAASYWLLLVAAFVHQSYGLLLAGLLVAIDGLSNAAVTRPAVLVPATIALTVSLVRDEAWPRFLLIPTPWLIGIAGAGVVAIVIVRRLGRRPPVSDWRQRALHLRSRVDGADRVVADLLLLTMSWLLVFGISAIGYRHATPDQKTYFFQVVNGRLLAMLQPVLVLGVFLTVLRWWRPGNRIVKAVPVVLILAATAAGVAAAAQAALQIREQLVTGMRQRFPVYEQRMKTSLHPSDKRLAPDDIDIDILLLYPVARSLDAGVDFVSPFVK